MSYDVMILKIEADLSSLKHCNIDINPFLKEFSLLKAEYKRNKTTINKIAEFMKKVEQYSMLRNLSYLLNDCHLFVGSTYGEELKRVINRIAWFLPWVNNFEDRYNPDVKRYFNAYYDLALDVIEEEMRKLNSTQLLEMVKAYDVVRKDMESKVRERVEEYDLRNQILLEKPDDYLDEEFLRMFFMTSIPQYLIDGEINLINSEKKDTSRRQREIKKEINQRKHVGRKFILKAVALGFIYLTVLISSIRIVEPLLSLADDTEIFKEEYIIDNDGVMTAENTYEDDPEKIVSSFLDVKEYHDIDDETVIEMTYELESDDLGENFTPLDVEIQIDSKSSSSRIINKDSLLDPTIYNNVKYKVFRILEIKLPHEYDMVSCSLIGGISFLMLAWGDCFLKWKKRGLIYNLCQYFNNAYERKNELSEIANLVITLEQEREYYQTLTQSQNNMIDFYSKEERQELNLLREKK